MNRFPPMRDNFRQTKPKAWMLALVLHCRRHGPVTTVQLYELVRAHSSLTVTRDDLLMRMRRAGLNVDLIMDAKNNRRYLITESFSA